MTEPTANDLIQSIDELKSYKDRLQKEIKIISKKLRIKSQNVEMKLGKQAQIKDIEDAIERLTKQLSLLK
tara:strand:+ start:168 stop:377 length:210 start_codon:yes stop_codon:yes gene_type:complete